MNTEKIEPSRMAFEDRATDKDLADLVEALENGRATYGENGEEITLVNATGIIREFAAIRKERDRLIALVNDLKKSMSFEKPEHPALGPIYGEVTPENVRKAAKELYASDMMPSAGMTTLASDVCSWYADMLERMRKESAEVEGEPVS